MGPIGLAISEKGEWGRLGFDQAGSVKVPGAIGAAREEREMHLKAW
jgi:hypothetical protein